MRQRDIAFSVRSGPQVERLINPLISVHSQKSKLAFEGAGSAEVGVEFYPEGFVPPEGCVVLTASHWDAMKWAMELAGKHYAITFAEQMNLQGFMETAIRLFRESRIVTSRIRPSLTPRIGGRFAKSISTMLHSSGSRPGCRKASVSLS